MRFVLYTELSVAQCMSALNERLQVKGTSSRPALVGWTEKEGYFSVAVSSDVGWRALQFGRTTRLRGQAVRDKSLGATVIKGFVPEGLAPRSQLLLFGGTAALGLIMFLSGNIFLALLIVLTVGVFFIPFMGDRNNSDYLLKELRRLLQAKDKPPKPAILKSAAAKPAAGKPAPAKPVGVKPAGVKPGAARKPAPRR